MFALLSPPSRYNRKPRCGEAAGGVAPHGARLGTLAPEVAPEPVCRAVPLVSPAPPKGGASPRRKTGILEQTILCPEGCPACGRMSSGILGLYYMPTTPMPKL